MAYANYTTQTVRASAATSGTSGQDSSITLPDSVDTFFVVVNKTAEFAGDNLITVRLQAQVGSDWMDIPRTWAQRSAEVTSAGDVAISDDYTPNIVDAFTNPSWSYIAKYENPPSRVIRSVWIASGTTPSHTFSIVASYRLNEF